MQISERKKMFDPVPCPKCKKGHLLAFLKPVSNQRREGDYVAVLFMHYLIYYKCSNPDCDYLIKGWDDNV
jgi:hypothetical protein